MTPLSKAIHDTKRLMRDCGEVVHTDKWQSVDISENPNAKMVEVLHHSFVAKIPETLTQLRCACLPNLPWADDHFQERVCGQPINPGIEWANWPWGQSADGHREKNGQFNHNYMERYWPENAKGTNVPTLSADQYRKEIKGKRSGMLINRGLSGHPFGDLKDVVELLNSDPTTRQAYFAVWHPDDQSILNEGRKPCTIGYHFIMRNGKLDIRYDIRSCDMFRHFGDDIYLTILLGQWILKEVQDMGSPVWQDVTMGNFSMNITSLHMFIGDYQKMFKRNPEE